MKEGLYGNDVWKILRDEMGWDVDVDNGTAELELRVN